MTALAAVVPERERERERERREEGGRRIKVATDPPRFTCPINVVCVRVCVCVSVLSCTK